jgi:tRNA 2-thiocytidine biosynthesis protein TtcA
MHPDAIVRRVLDAMGRAMGHYAMLRAGDRVAVGVSGGKDSLTLLHALAAFRRRAPFPYDLVAVTVEQGKFKAPIGALENAIARIGVPWIVREDRPTLRLVQRGIQHGCDVCSRHRRSALYRIATEQGCTALALGHTADDCAEALLRNILFNGRIAPLPPLARSRKGALRLIRPLVWVGEDMTEAYADSHGLGTVGCVCADRTGPRREIREFLSTLSTRYPNVPTALRSALERLAARPERAGQGV